MNLETYLFTVRHYRITGNTMTQDEALKIMKGNNNIFLTGPPGSGKSYLTNKYIDWVSANGKIVCVTASTGIAALQLSGSTLHSWAGIRNEDVTEEDIVDITSNYYNKKRIGETEVLIVDEVSMVSPKLLEVVNLIAIKIRGTNKPFGGIKVIFCGDFFQLPPVSKSKLPPYAFESPLWQSLNLTTCYLTEQHRTDDVAFIEILRGIRTGTLTEQQKQVLRDRVIADAEGVDAIRLDTHNDAVDRINDARLRMLDGAPSTYVMTSSGNEKLVQSMKKNCMSPERLTLKVGTPVMFTKNDIDLRWVNGTRGTVVSLGDDTVRVKVNGIEYDVEETSWEYASGYGKNKTTHATLTQIPLRVAYAITVHKSQGMTLNSAIIDCSRAFACGHGYVAVSRVRSLDGLHFQGKLTQGTFAIDERVRAFDNLIKA